MADEETPTPTATQVGWRNPAFDELGAPSVIPIVIAPGEQTIATTRGQPVTCSPVDAKRRGKTVLLIVGVSGVALGLGFLLGRITR